MNQSKNVLATFQGRASGRGSMLGWGISLLLHTMMIASLWSTLPPRLSSVGLQQERRMEVWLVPSATSAPLPEIVTPSTVAPPHLTLARATPSRSRKTRQSSSTAAPTTPAVAQSAALVTSRPAQVSLNEAAKLDSSDMPVFDLVAARSTARAMASEGREDMGARMTREEAMTTTKSERIQERFERARRVNCLKPNESANLLANVALLARDMVANAVDDSGCKW
jgi:hypothetical protein